MPLVNMRDMLYHAYENNYAVGAFDLVSLDFLEAVIDAAETCRSAVILSVAEHHFAHYDFHLMLAAVEKAAQNSTIPVAIQFDHGRSYNSVVNAIKLGCNGVMLDVSNLEFLDNIKNTLTVTEMAHQCGVSVVGELGYVAGNVGEGAEQHPGETEFTLPSEAKVYVERTGVDCLAVSVGTVQGRVNGKVKLDYARLKQLNQAVKVPLAVHGGSGLSEDQFHKLIFNGVAKIDYYTALSDVAAKAMRQSSKDHPKGSFIDLKKEVKKAIGDEVVRCLRLWGSAGRAAEILERCDTWLNINHVITHNLSMNANTPIKPLIEEGRKVLQAIPGVRDVFIGESMDEDNTSLYRYFWSINFTHQQALESFHKKNEFSSFLNQKLMPNVTGLIRSDYQEKLK